MSNYICLINIKAVQIFNALTYTNAQKYKKSIYNPQL